MHYFSDRSNVRISKIYIFLLLFSSVDSSPPVSHAIVLPQDPNSGPPPGATPSVLPDTSQDDALDIFGMSAGAAGVGRESVVLEIV